MMLASFFLFSLLFLSSFFPSSFFFFLLFSASSSVCCSCCSFCILFCSFSEFTHFSVPNLYSTENETRKVWGRPSRTKNQCTIQTRGWILLLHGPASQYVRTVAVPLLNSSPGRNGNDGGKTSLRSVRSANRWGHRRKQKHLVGNVSSHQMQCAFVYLSLMLHSSYLGSTVVFPRVVRNWRGTGEHCGLPARKSTPAPTFLRSWNQLKFFVIGMLTWQTRQNC